MWQSSRTTHGTGNWPKATPINLASNGMCLTLNPRGTSPRTAIGSFPPELVMIIQEIKVSAIATKAFLTAETKKKVWAKVRTY